MTFHRLAAAFLVASLLAASIYAAEKPSQKQKRTDAYPGSFKLPGLGGLGGLTGKLGSSLSASARLQSNSRPVSPPVHETLEVSSIPPPKVPPLLHRDPEVDAPAPTDRPGVKPASTRPAARLAPPEPNSTLQFVPDTAVDDEPAEMPKEIGPADEEQADEESVEAEFAAPIKPSQLSDQVRHGPVRRVGMYSELLAPAPPAKSRVTVAAPAKTPPVAFPPSLKQTTLTADDLSGKEPPLPRSSAARRAALSVEAEPRQVALTASPAALLKAVENLDQSGVESERSNPRAVQLESSEPSWQPPTRTASHHKETGKPLSGKIEQVDVHAGLVMIRFPSSHSPQIGSRVKVMHKSFMRTSHVGELKIVGFEDGSYLAQALGDLKLNRLAHGDEVLPVASSKR